MGICGLLPVLKPIQENTTLESYRGKTLAVDTYAWLHKAVFSCAMDLVLERPTRAYVNYFIRRLEMFKYFNITPYFVFDGDYLPTKSNTETERAERRSDQKRMALEALKSGNNKLANTFFQKACDVTPEMAKTVIDEFKLRNIKYIVAPYEADSQMVFLEQQGLVDGIISEDSDLLIFGCKTLITKLKDRGECIEIKRENFKNCKGSHIALLNDEQLQTMAAVSGCDYTKGISGIGIQKAITLVKKYNTYDRVIMGIRYEGKTIPANYAEEYQKAIIAFRHQIVFNPYENIAQHLNPLSEEVVTKFTEEFIHSCTGNYLNQETHRRIANGDLNPLTKKALLSRELQYEGEQQDSSKNKRSSTVPSLKNNLDSLMSFKRAKTCSLPVSLSIKKVADASITSQKSVYTRRKKALFTIDHFMKGINKEKLDPLTAQQSFRLSPVAKRQKTLLTHNIDSKNGHNGNFVSKFFSPKMHNSKLNAEEFQATATDNEESISDEDSKIFNLSLTGSQENQDVLKGINSSDFILTDPEDYDEPTNPAMSTDTTESGSTDPGDVNAECYLEDQSEDSVDKSNVLDEIYSFKKAKDNKNNIHDGLNSTTYFTPAKWLKTLENNRNGSKIQQKSPLRVPLKEVSNSQSTQGIRNKKLGIERQNGSNNMELSAFRYYPK